MMNIETFVRRLREPAVFLCSILPDRGDGKYRVPVEHRRLGKTGVLSRSILRKLPDGDSFDQLRYVLNDGPLGLFAAAKRWLVKYGRPGWQEAMGSVLLLPPSQWWAEKRALARWQFDGVDAAFASLPYSFRDIRVFAKLNFSPDCWFIVVAGPMAGNVFSWTHDGASDLTEPWAHDFTGWLERVWNEAPGVFGGIIRFTAADSIDEVPADAELFPERLVMEARE